MIGNYSCGVQVMRLLADYGTKVIFGIPGVHTVELYRGISLTGIKHVTPRHEQGAAFMADGYARSTGKVGVCCLITGPGVTNAATALAQSYSDSVPVLAISSVNKSNSLGMNEGDLHELRNQQLLTEQFTAFSYTIRTVDEVPEVMEQAYAVFDSKRPRPVHIEIPIDLLDQIAKFDSVLPARTNLPSPPQDQLDKALKLLTNSDQAAIIFGGGSINAYLEARELVDLLNLPTVLTFAAKGVIPDDHPLCLGSNLLHPPVLDFLQGAGVVLAVGTQLSETDIWVRDGDIHFDGTLIRNDIDPQQMHVNAKPDIPILGDAKQSLANMILALKKSKVRRNNQRQQNCSIVKSLLEQTKQYWFASTQSHAVIWDTIREVLPMNGIVTADSSQIVYSGNYYYRGVLPRTYLTSTTGYGTLGFALPAAIGAKFGCPETPVVCVAGDGGLLFTIQELATAAENKLPIVIVLWNNDAYGEIRDTFDRLNIERIGVDLASPDFIAVAKGFHCNAQRIESKEQLKLAIREGLKSDRPTLLEVRTDSSFLSAKA